MGCGREPAPFNRDPTGSAWLAVRPRAPRWVAVKRANANRAV